MYGVMKREGVGWQKTRERERVVKREGMAKDERD
jgi:hypothetical protein